MHWQDLDIYIYTHTDLDKGKTRHLFIASCLELSDHLLPSRALSIDQAVVKAGGRTDCRFLLVRGLRLSYTWSDSPPPTETVYKMKEDGKRKTRCISVA